MLPFDTLMFRGEDDPRTRSTLTGVFILDRAPDWDTLVETWERVSRVIVPLRQRVVQATMTLGLPMWVVDPDFDLSYHLRRTRLPLPGTQRQLLDYLEPITMAPLDRARPLWEFTLVEGLEDNAAAFVMKVNHAVTDGVGGQAMAQIAFDLQREVGPKVMPPLPIPEDLSPGDLMVHDLVRAPGEAVATASRAIRTAARAAGEFAVRPGRAVSGTAAYFQSLGRVMGGPGAKPSPLTRQRSLRRHLDVVEASLDDLRAASKSAGGSLNDGLLAAVCGGVRLYHEHFGVPVESIPLAMPINLRTDADPAGGNQWTGVQLAPPVSEKDPAARIRAIREEVAEARREPALNAMSAVAPLAARIPMWLLSTAFGGVNATGPDMQVSNIPGSPVPLYLAGAKVTKTLGFGPVPGAAAMLTLNSYVHDCFIGINLDPAAITDPDLFAQCLRDGVDEVLTLRPRPPRRNRSDRG